MTTVGAADAGPDTSFCASAAVVRNLHATGIGSYSWTPAIYLDNPGSQNPVATVTATTKFYLTITNANGCSGMDSVAVTVNTNPLVRSIANSAICKGTGLVLSTTGASSYTWTSAAYVSNPAIANPLFIAAGSQTIYVTGMGSNGCSAKDTINVTIKPLPMVSSIADPLICSNQSVTLTTTGAVIYSWSLATALNNSNTGNLVFTGTADTYTYVVTGTAASNCSAKDTVNLVVRSRNSLVAPKNVEDVCQFKTVQLIGNNGNAVLYSWSPAITLSNPAIINPFANPVTSTSYTLVITDTVCRFDSSFFVTVRVNRYRMFTLQKRTILVVRNALQDYRQPAQLAIHGPRQQR